MMPTNIITEASKKEDIIDAALELIDDKTAQVSELQQQQRVLMTITAAMVVVSILSIF